MRNKTCAAITMLLLILVSVECELITQKNESAAVKIETLGYYSVSDAIYYTHARGDTELGPLELEAIAYVPVDKNPEEEHPIAVVFSGGGFDATFLKQHIDYWRELTSSGMIVVSPDYRCADDFPTSSNDEPGDTLKTKALRAGLQYDQQNFLLDLADRKRFLGRRTGPIILIGWSAGGVSSLYHAAKKTIPIEAVIVFSCAFDLDISFASPPTSDDHTRDIRKFITESDLTDGMPRMLACLIEHDRITGEGANTRLRDAMLELSPMPEIHWKEFGTPPLHHDGPHQWGTINEKPTVVYVAEWIANAFSHSEARTPQPVN